MKTNVTYTFNLYPFIKNNVPSVEEKYMVDHINPSFLLPLGDYINKTLYMSCNEQGKMNLTAFRILAWAVTHRWDVSDYKFGISFYIQKPNETAKWVDWGVLPTTMQCNYHKPTKALFWSVDDYLRHVNGETVAEPIDWTRVDRVLDLESSYNDRCCNLERSYYWDGDDIKKRASRLTYIMGDANGVFIGLRHKCSNYYNSKADCLKSRLDNMEIVDFDDEPHEIHIDVQQKGARVHTLRFIEE